MSNYASAKQQLATYQGLLKELTANFLEGGQSITEYQADVKTFTSSIKTLTTALGTVPTVTQTLVTSIKGFSTAFSAFQTAFRSCCRLGLSERQSVGGSV